MESYRSTPPRQTRHPRATQLQKKKLDQPKQRVSNSLKLAPCRLKVARAPPPGKLCTAIRQVKLIIRAEIGKVAFSAGQPSETNVLTIGAEELLERSNAR